MTRTFFPRSAWALLALASALLPTTLPAQWTDGRKANSVMGQANFTGNAAGMQPSPSSMWHPVGVAVHPASGKVFVAEIGDGGTSGATVSRVTRFSSRAAMARGADAEAAFGTSSLFGFPSLLSPDEFRFSPAGIFVDHQGNLWIADSLFHRVLRFDNAVNGGSGPPADLVLGQPDFVTDTANTTIDGMDSPTAVTVDLAGNLWVADTGNNRVLRFDGAVNMDETDNGADADRVLGQPDFDSSGTGYDPDQMDGPQGLAAWSSYLWVSDSNNHRVLRFDGIFSLGDGAEAEEVLGQATFFALPSAGLTQVNFDSPREIALSSSGDLWVADHNNNRVLRFANAANQGTYPPADLVIGQATFTKKTAATSVTTLRSPSGVAIDSGGNLFVADTGNHRVTRYSPGHPQPDNLVGKTANPNHQKGDNLYNGNAAGQRLKIREKKRKVAKAYFTVQNDGPFDDRFQFRATKRNRKVKVKYFRTTGGRANITGQIVTGRYSPDVIYRSDTRLMAKVRLTKRAKRRAKRPLALRSTSLTNGAADRVLAKMILIRKKKKR